MISEERPQGYPESLRGDARVYSERLGGCSPVVVKAVAVVTVAAAFGCTAASEAALVVLFVF